LEAIFEFEEVFGVGSGREKKKGWLKNDEDDPAMPTT